MPEVFSIPSNEHTLLRCWSLSLSQLHLTPVFRMNLAHGLALSLCSPFWEGLAIPDQIIMPMRQWGKKTWVLLNSLVKSILPWEHQCLSIVSHSSRFWEVFGWHFLPVELSWSIQMTLQLTVKKGRTDWTFISGGPQLCPQFSKGLEFNPTFLGDSS